MRKLGQRAADTGEIVFDNVRVPYENLVVEVNRGWDCAKFLLGNERTGIARVGYSKAKLKRIRELAKLELDGAEPVFNDPKFRTAIGYAVEAINKGLDKSLDEGLELEAEIFGKSCGTEDARTGAQAFMEKNPNPNFRGR